MAIAIRLSRGGAKKRPYYRIVAADSRSPRDGKYLEQVGIYNPLLAKDDEGRVKLNEERIKYWLSVGGQPSDRVARFLDAAGIRERAARNNPNKAKPGEKATERLEEKAEKAEAAEEAKKAAEEEAKEAKKAAAEAAKAEAETPKEEAPAEEAAPEAEAAAEAPAEEAAPEAAAEEAPSEDASEDKAEG